MAASVLVAYATKYGSTREVADAVAEWLRYRGLEVELSAASELRSLHGFDAVVLGAPLYGGSLLKEARKFLAKHQAALEKVPVALFVLGPTSGLDDLETSRAELDGALEKLAWFDPVTKDVFVGAYDPDKLRFPDSKMAARPTSPLYDMEARDDRDWDAIRAWADSLPDVLGLETPAR